MQEKITKDTEHQEQKKITSLPNSSSSNPFLNESELPTNPFESSYKHPLAELPTSPNPFTVSVQPVQRKEEEKTSKQKENNERLNNISNMADLGKNVAAELAEVSTATDKFNLTLAKNGSSFLTEFSKKMQSGASFDESCMFALTKIGVEHITGLEKFKTLVGGKAPNGKIAILVSGLKAAGFTKAADILDVASKMSRLGLVGQGIVEGFTGMFDLVYIVANNGFDEEKLEKMRQNQIKGDYGPITQGYSILAALISSLALKDAREMEEISLKAGRGELGTLPEIGDKLGIVAYDAQARIKETLKNKNTDDILRAKPTAEFEKLSAYEKYEAIHQLITGNTSKEDIDTIIRIMSTVKTKADRDLICEQYLKRTYQLDRYSVLTIENALKIDDYKQERQGGTTGKFDIKFKLDKILTSSRKFPVTNGKVKISITATSATNDTKYEVELFENRLFSSYSQKISLVADGKTYTYEWKGVPLGASFDFKITTEKNIEGKATVNVN